MPSSSGWSPIFRWTGTCCRRSCEKAVRPRQRRELGQKDPSGLRREHSPGDGADDGQPGRATTNHQSRRDPKTPLKMRLRPRSGRAEEKVRIVIAGLRGEESIAELCRKEGVSLLRSKGTGWWMTQSAANRYPVYIHTVVYKLAVV